MRLSKCEDCGKFTLLTKHSPVGSHLEGHGWIYLCRSCHDCRHSIVQKKKTKQTGKYAPGTPKHKKK